MSASSQPRSFRAALVQMCSGRAVDTNVARASELIREAAAGGAQYVLTPEMTTLMELERPRLMEVVKPEAGNEALAHFQVLAREVDVWLHIGSMPILLSNGKLANRSFLISPDGQITARYDKIHMFDIDLGGGEKYEESANYQPGGHAVIADLPWGPLGLTICYDLRFPTLFRALARAGARFIAIPSAFTRPTGMAHWHTLLRARAIESQAYIFAAAQAGTHENGRATFGHSLIVSPWGEILAEAGNQPGVIAAEIDLQLLEDVRSRVPSLQHDRHFDVLHAAKQDAGEVAS
jgi:deaminated glutathione amidase